MLREWFSRLRQGHYRTTVRGLTATTIWQIANYALPLITFPYLARVLGVEGFGLIGLTVAIMGYAHMVTDWGFSLTATQAVAQNRQDPEAVNRIIWSTVMAKAGLALLCITCVVTATFFVPPALAVVLLVSIVGLVAKVVTLDWALRGAEAFGRFASASIIGRVLVLPLVFLLVRTENDAAMAVLVTSLAEMATAALSNIWAVRMALLRWPDIKPHDAWKRLKSGTDVFISTAAASLYGGTIPMALGVVGGPATVGLYTAGTRVRIPVQSLLSPISMVFFPRMGSLTASDHGAGERVAKRLLLIQGSAALLLTLVLVLAAPLIVPILLGDEFIGAVPVLQIQAWIVFFGGVTSVFGTMIMLPFGMNKEFRVSIFYGAAVCLISLVPLIYLYGAVGAALVSILAEITISTKMFLAINSRFKWIRLRSRLA